MYFSICFLLTVCLLSQSLVVFRLSEASKDVGFKRQVFENVVTEVECCKCKEKIQVNPFDMLNYVHGAKTMKDNNEKPSYLKGESCPQTDTIQIQTKLYLQRFVNLLLMAAGLKDFHLDSGHKIVNMELNISHMDLKLIQEYANTGAGTLERIDGTLSRILRQKNVKTVHKGDGLLADIDYVYYTKLVLTTLATLPVDYPMICIAFFVSLVFIMTVRHMRRYTLFYSMVLMLFIIFCTGFGWNWLRMIKEEEAKIASTYALYMKQLPIHCRPHDMTWYERIWYHSYEKDCEKYFKEISIDPVVRISPTLVLSETVTMMLLHPAGKIGSAFGEFLAAFIDPIPFAHKWYLVPIVLVLMFFTFFLTYVVLIGGVISFKTLLGSFEIGYRERSTSRVDHRPVRQMIEEVPQGEEDGGGRGRRRMIEREEERIEGGGGGERGRGRRIELERREESGRMIEGGETRREEERIEEGGGERGRGRRIELERRGESGRMIEGGEGRIGWRVEEEEERGRRIEGGGGGEGGRMMEEEERGLGWRIEEERLRMMEGERREEGGGRTVENGGRAERRRTPEKERVEGSGSRREVEEGNGRKRIEGVRRISSKDDEREGEDWRTAESGGGGGGSGRRRIGGGGEGRDDERRRMDGGGGIGELDKGGSGDSPKTEGRVEFWGERGGGGREEAVGGGERVGNKTKTGEGADVEERWIKEEDRQRGVGGSYGETCDKCGSEGRIKKGKERGSGGIEEEGEKVEKRLVGKEEEEKMVERRLVGEKERVEQNETENVERKRDKVGGYVRRLKLEGEGSSGGEKINEGGGEEEEEEEGENVHSNFSPRAFKELKSIYKRFRKIVANNDDDSDDNDNSESRASTPDISGVEKLGRGAKS